MLENIVSATEFVMSGIISRVIEIVNVGNVDSFKGQLDQYYRCIRGFK